MAVNVNKGRLLLFYIFARFLAYVYGDVASSKDLRNHHHDWQQIENSNITTSMKHGPAAKMGKKQMPIILYNIFFLK